jgi:hypothetical protein
MLTVICLDSEAQKKILKEDPEACLEYGKMIEAEIGQRVRFLVKNGPEATEAKRVSPFFFPILDCRG